MKIIKTDVKKMFPQKTYEKMLQIVKNEFVYDNPFRQKFEDICDLNSIDKMNRWFGYYQKQGEIMGLWTLEEIKEWVRNEKIGDNNV